MSIRLAGLELTIVARAGLEFAFLLSLFPKCWTDRCEPTDLFTTDS